MSGPRVRRVARYDREAVVEPRADGSLMVRMPEPLAPYPHRATERLEHWAAFAPGRLFLAGRVREGWRRVSYAQALHMAGALGQALLDRGLSVRRPVLILAGRGIEHALLSLACLHVGVPFVPVSPASSSSVAGLARLREIAGLVQPGLVFVDEGTRHAAAVGACCPEGAEVVVAHGDPGRPATVFEALTATTPTPAVASAAAAVHSGTLAKLLFTFGPTGAARGVITTHGMLCGTQRMLTTAYPTFAEEPPVLVDGLPWHDALGGTSSFGLVLFNGGSLYIDDGQPAPVQITETVGTLREVAPLVHMSSARGYAALVPWLRHDRTLRERFFSRVRMLHYAGARLEPPVADAIDAIAVNTVGERIQWATMLASPEAQAITVFWPSPGAAADAVGVPMPGVTLKLVPMNDRLEVRVHSPSVAPGYWRREDLTAALFDDEGFLRTGDALMCLEAGQPQRGFRYAGRLADVVTSATAT